MFGLAACDEGEPGFVNERIPTVTTARQVEMRLQRPCTGSDNASENMEQTGTWVHQVAQAMEEQLTEDEQELKTWEQKKEN